jgi:MFS family permease
MTSTIKAYGVTSETVGIAASLGSVGSVLAFIPFNILTSKCGVRSA